jgi:predicted tellurium resistance membrane protein TerC
MNLSIGVFFLCLSAVFFSIAILFYRNPKLPNWADGFLILSLCVIAIIGWGATGLVMIISSFEKRGTISPYHLLWSAVLVGVAVLTIWLLRIPRRLRQYA